MKAGLIAFLCLSAAGAAAQSRPAAPPQPPPHPLSIIATLSCTFPLYATVDIAKAVPDVIQGKQELSFKITGIDAIKRAAQIVGAAGTAEATLVLTPTGLNVIERTPIGNLVLTTVFVVGGQGTSFRAVHSRHIGDLTSPPSASQSYGTCQTGE
jgi:hypothetical protein